MCVYDVRISYKLGVLDTDDTRTKKFLPACVRVRCVCKITRYKCTIEYGNNCWSNYFSGEETLISLWDYNSIHTCNSYGCYIGAGVEWTNELSKGMRDSADNKITVASHMFNWFGLYNLFRPQIRIRFENEITTQSSIWSVREGPGLFSLHQ